MNFPHQALRQTAAHDRDDHRAMLATAIARQANSQTARAMATLSALPISSADARRDMVEQRIHYFGSGDHSAHPPFGAFFTANSIPETVEPNIEQHVYQNASTNFKAHDLENDGTGEQSTDAGHGATRTLC